MKSQKNKKILDAKDMDDDIDKKIDDLLQKFKIEGPDDNHNFFSITICPNLYSMHAFSTTIHCDCHSFCNINESGIYSVKSNPGRDLVDVVRVFPKDSDVKVSKFTRVRIFPKNRTSLNIVCKKHAFLVVDSFPGRSQFFFHSSSDCDLIIDYFFQKIAEQFKVSKSGEWDVQSRPRFESFALM